MVNLAGKWKEHKSENWDKFMEAAEMPWLVRKVAGKMSPSYEIKQDGDHFVIINPKGQNEFTVGQEFETSPPFDDKKKMKGLARWDGEKLVVTTHPKDNPDGKSMTVTRELVSDDELLMTMETGDVTCKRWLKRQ